MKSPIAFFAFNRPFHTLRALQSLCRNPEAKETDLYAFIDGPRKISETQLIDNVEKIIKSFSDKFNSLKVYRSAVNQGGAINQKRGISNVLAKYQSVISLEDDIYVSKYFLSYMNNALRIYNNQKEVWHINGFNYPIKLDGDFECFFIRTMHCWGWATWRDRWEKFMEEPLSCDPYYLKSIFTEKMVKEFDLNLNKSIFWSQVDDNLNGKLNNTWDIFWYSFIFINKGLCLTPKVSMTRNIGHDGSGIHSTIDRDYLFSKVNEGNIIHFPETIHEDRYCFKKIRKYLKKKNSIFSRLLRKFFNFSKF